MAFGVVRRIRKKVQGSKFKVPKKSAHQALSIISKVGAESP